MIAAPNKYEVVIRRSNGRFLKAIPAPSKYAAKVIKRKQEDKYDPYFSIEIRPLK